MSGQACQNINESELDERRSRPPESVARRRRSQVDTLPASDPFTDALAASMGLPSYRPDWCVDTGGRLFAMTTFQLWTALDRADVPPSVRVWREGMECWTPVVEVPEFAWAMACSLHLTPPAASVTPLTPAEPSSLVQSAVTPAPSAPVAMDRPIRAVSRELSFPDAGGRWVALGSAVAAAAMCATMVVVAVRSTSSQTGAAAPLPATSLPGASPNLHTPATSPPPEDITSAVKPPPLRREERGQHRLPRDGQRAYGR